MSNLGVTAAAASVVLVVVALLTWSPGAERAVSAVGPAPDGSTLFRAKGCATCHTGPDSTSPIGAGPPLVDAGEWAGERRPGMDARAYLAESIREPAAFFSPEPFFGSMPDLGLEEEEIDALVTYLLGG